MNDTVVLTFTPWFAWKVSIGLKTSTIRKRNTARVGDVIECIYSDRSMMSDHVKCNQVDEVYMTACGFKLNGVSLTAHRIQEIAIADGFNSVDEFRSFFEKLYGFPFSGEMISWEQ